MRVMMQVRPEPELVAAVGDPDRTVAPSDLAAQLTGLQPDEDFEPVLVPQAGPADASGDPLSLRQPLTYSRAAERASVLVRGELDDADLGPRTSMLLANNPALVGVFAEPRQAVRRTCQTPRP